MKNNRAKFLALLALLLVGLFLLTSVSPVVLAKDDKKAKETKAEAKVTEKLPDNEAKVEGKINIYTRDSSSGTREGFEKVVGIKKNLTDEANEVSSNGDMATKVGNDPNGIGYCSLSTDFKANKVLPVYFEGVEPTVENVIDESYKMARPFCYVLRKSGTYDSKEKEELVKAFIAYITESKEGMETIASAGGVVDVEKGKDWEEVKKDYPIVDKDNSDIEIKTVGSTSVEKVINTALEEFQSLAGGFTFKMNQTGSGDGWKRVLGDEKDGPNKGDIGFASRDFKDEEDTKDSISSGMFCQDAIVVIVSEKNSGMHNFSKDQLLSVFTGETTEWKDLAAKKK